MRQECDGIDGAFCSSTLLGRCHVVAYKFVHSAFWRLSSLIWCGSSTGSNAVASLIPSLPTAVSIALVPIKIKALPFQRTPSGDKEAYMLFFGAPVSPNTTHARQTVVWPLSDAWTSTATSSQLHKHHDTHHLFPRLVCRCSASSDDPRLGQPQHSAMQFPSHDNASWNSDTPVMLALWDWQVPVLERFPKHSSPAELTAHATYW